MKSEKPIEKPMMDLYRKYIAGDLPKKDLIGRLFQYLLNNYERYRLFDGNLDRWNEYLSWLYPRLVRAVDTYREQGASFDAYMNGIVHCASKEYRCREADHSITEYVCWRAKMEEMILCDNESEYYESRREIEIPPDIKPRQILLLLLKSYYFVSDELVKKVAPFVGVEPGIIRAMLEELRKKRSGREAAINKFRDQVYSQHYRCLAYQKRLSNTTPGTDYHEKMKGCFDRAEQRFHAMKKRLTGMRLEASNRMIAEVMGIPKGTVDSGLSAVKQRLRSIQPLQNNNQVDDREDRSDRFSENR